MSLAENVARNNARAKANPAPPCPGCGTVIIYSTDGYCGNCQRKRLLAVQEKAWREGKYYIQIPPETSRRPCIILRRWGQASRVAEFECRHNGEIVGETADGWNINADVWDLVGGGIPSPLTREFILSKSH